MFVTVVLVPGVLQAGDPGLGVVPLPPDQDPGLAVRQRRLLESSDQTILNSLQISIHNSTSTTPSMSQSGNNLL